MNLFFGFDEQLIGLSKIETIDLAGCSSGVINAVLWSFGKKRKTPRSFECSFDRNGSSPF
jgi:hypothetical protein